MASATDSTAPVRAYAFIMWGFDDIRFSDWADRLEDAFWDLNISVTRQVLGPVSHQPPNGQTTLSLAYHNYLRWAESNDEEGRLLIVCYIGHAQIQTPDEDSYQHYDTLAAGVPDNGNWLTFDLTNFHSDLYDERKANGLILRACCDGEYMLDRGWGTNSSKRCVEVIAAGKGDINPDCWFERLFVELEWLSETGGTMTVHDLHLAIEYPDDEYGPGFHGTEFDTGAGPIELRTFAE